MKTKIQIYKTLVKSIMTYVANKTNSKKINVMLDIKRNTNTYREKIKVVRTCKKSQR